ncbi:MAG TPA: DNA-binding domain-containing protein [Thermoanaerobaculia bacterium]|nr:DNA-binding domain-containing protein [Thermoanaerobaculia bacterium]
MRASLDLNLPRLQRWMQAVIEAPGTVDEAVLSEAARAELDPADIDRVILPSQTLTAVERVGVYQGMYLLRMIEALEGDYPAVAHFLGDEEFGGVVTRYVAAHPSRSFTFNRLGERFPEFLKASRGIRRKGFVADLARLELAVTEVFDAPESDAWPAEAVARIPEEAWAGAVLKPIAAFRLGAYGYPVNAYLQSVKEENHDHPDVGRKATFAAVWRKGFEVWRLDLSKPAYEFLGALAKGRPFGKAVAAAARGMQGNPGDQLFRWLRDWVAEGMFQGIDI